jgi:hypothetical protein
MDEGHSELAASTEGSPAWTLDALAHAAWQLEPPPTHERKSVLRPEAAHLVDSLLARVARGRGALDVTIGAALASLSEGDRVLQLGYSSIGDYTRGAWPCDAREFAQGRFGILEMVDEAGSEHLVDGGVPPSGDEGSGPDGGGAPRGAARLGLAWSRRSS